MVGGRLGYAPSMRFVAGDATQRIEISGLSQARLDQIIAASMNVAVAPVRALPAAEANEVALDSIGFDCNNIPQKYCCMLSGAVMTHPVYDINNPVARFEKSWILYQLTIRRENPATRTPLIAENLRDDLALKAEIDLFVTTMKGMPKDSRDHSALKANIDLFLSIMARADKERISLINIEAVD